MAKSKTKAPQAPVTVITPAGAPAQDPKMPEIPAMAAVSAKETIKNRR